MLRIVADLGNSRLKWGRVGSESAGVDARPAARRPGGLGSGLGGLEPGRAEGSGGRSRPSTRPWPSGWARSWGARGRVDTLVSLGGRRPDPARPGAPETAGADRAWRSWRRERCTRPAGPAWSSRAARRSPSSGSRPTASGKGARSRPGLGLSARASTADRPVAAGHPTRPRPPGAAPPAPRWRPGFSGASWGRSASCSTRQAAGLRRPWLVWTGGDAPLLGPAVAGEAAFVVDDLVLHGLVRRLRRGCGVKSRGVRREDPPLTAFERAAVLMVSVEARCVGRTSAMRLDPPSPPPRVPC